VGRCLSETALQRGRALLLTLTTRLIEAFFFCCQTFLIDVDVDVAWRSFFLGSEGKEMTFSMARRFRYYFFSLLSRTDVSGKQASEQVERALVYSS